MGSDSTKKRIDGQTDKPAINKKEAIENKEKKNKNGTIVGGRLLKRRNRRTYGRTGNTLFYRDAMTHLKKAKEQVRLLDHTMQLPGAAR